MPREKSEDAIVLRARESRVQWRRASLDDMVYRAQAHPQAVFTALVHHLTPEFLEEIWQPLNRQGTLGLSGEKMEAYGRTRGPRIQALVGTLKARAY